MFKLTVILAFLFFTLSVNAEYAGRYTDGKDYAVYFEQTQYGLSIRPVMWTATQLLREVEKDKFVVVDRPSRRAEFRRDAHGNVTGVSISGMDGEGLDLRREDSPLLPVEMLLDGRVRTAAAAYRARNETAKAVEIAEQVLRRLPTKTRRVVLFLNTLAPDFKTDAKFHTVLGYALVQAGNRESALKSFRRGLELDPDNEDAISALARLNALPDTTNESGWKLPFPLSAVFANPTTAEIAAVERDWQSRDLDPRGAREELRSTLTIADRSFNVRIVSHLVHGKRHYGTIITPPDTDDRSLPVIIEAKGVSPTYFPLDLTRLAAPRFMGDLSQDFIYVVPTFRGEVLNFNERTFTSEGDRTDALDGATDDTIALLSVALATTPQIDRTRICAFGHSRGGTVAMLTGIRDKRVACVVNWAGPTDWFYAMGTNGWTEEELWAEGLRTRASTQQTGGQNVERFLKRAVDREATLPDVRHRMIASSPLYFAHRLPTSQHHYGLEDPSVPVSNGVKLEARLPRSDTRVITRAPSARDLAARYQLFFYRGQGHDTDRIVAPVLSRKFILKNLEARR